jgi:hypothetical protein
MVVTFSIVCRNPMFIIVSQMNPIYTLLVFLLHPILISKSFIFCIITPCGAVKVNRCFEWIYCPHLQVRRVSQAGNHRITWRYISDDRTLHKHRCENLKSDIWYVLLSTPTFPKWSPSFRISDYTFVSFLISPIHASCPARPSFLVYFPY